LTLFPRTSHRPPHPMSLCRLDVKPTLPFQCFFSSLFGGCWLFFFPGPRFHPPPPPRVYFHPRRGGIFSVLGSPAISCLVTSPSRERGVPPPPPPGAFSPFSFLTGIQAVCCPPRGDRPVRVNPPTGVLNPPPPPCSLLRGTGLFWSLFPPFRGRPPPGAFSFLLPRDHVLFFQVLFSFLVSRSVLK